MDSAVAGLVAATAVLAVACILLVVLLVAVGKRVGQPVGVLVRESVCGVYPGSVHPAGAAVLDEDGAAASSAVEVKRTDTGAGRTKTPGEAADSKKPSERSVGEAKAGRPRRKSVARQVARAEDVLAHEQKWEIDVRKLRFRKRIGKGNFGEVWLATWLGSPVAVKTLLRHLQANDDVVRRFIDEIAMMSTLHHPNVVLFLGACTKAPNLCLVLEYCVHGSMHTFVRSEHVHHVRIALSLVYRFALDIARGVYYLHRKQNIVQRDLKARNILVDESLNAKVADFGQSRVLDGGPEQNHLTACGTPAWTAPEIVKMEKYTDKVDVYSFGIIMWELITRQEPYDGQRGVQIAYAAAEQGMRPPIPSFCPEDYAQLMSECWDQDPDMRPSFANILKRLFQMKKENDQLARAVLDAGRTREHGPVTIAGGSSADRHDSAVVAAASAAGSSVGRLRPDGVDDAVRASTMTSATATTDGGGAREPGATATAHAAAGSSRGEDATGQASAASVGTNVSGESRAEGASESDAADHVGIDEPGRGLAALFEATQRPPASAARRDVGPAPPIVKPSSRATTMESAGSVGSGADLMAAVGMDFLGSAPAAAAASAAPAPAPALDETPSAGGAAAVPASALSPNAQRALALASAGQMDSLDMLRIAEAQGLTVTAGADIGWDGDVESDDEDDTSSRGDASAKHGIPSERSTRGGGDAVVEVSARSAAGGAAARR